MNVQVNKDQQIRLVEPSNELFLRIAKRNREDQLYLAFRRRVVWALIGFSVSMVGFILALLWLIVGSAATGFSEVASLLGSDSLYVLQNWQAYGLSLLETLPVMNAIASLMLLSCVIWCGMQSISNFKGMRRVAQH